MADLIVHKFCCLSSLSVLNFVEVFVLLVAYFCLHLGHVS